MQNKLTWIVIAWICSGAILTTASGSNQRTGSCSAAKEVEKQCATYCYEAMKPMLEIVHQSHLKDAELAVLREEINELKVQLSAYKERESKNKELLEMAANVVAIKEHLFSNKTISNQSEDQCKESTKEKTIDSPNTCSSSSGLKKIKIPGLDEFSVPCNSQIAGPGWTLIDQRLNGSIDFYRDWDTYRKGFGNLDGEFFIGLEKLHHILASQPHEMYIWMEDMSGQTRYATYDNFMVGDESSGYKLMSLGRHSGNSTNAFQRNLGMKFTTFDRDNDMHTSINCADTYQDGWWHSACSDCNLHGIYNDAYHCIFWHEPQLHSNSDCLKKYSMLVRPKGSGNHIN